MRIADMRDVTVLASMPGARVIDRHIGGRRQPGLKQRVFLRMKGVLVRAQSRIDGAGGDINAPLAQLLVQQRLRDLAMMVLVEQVAAQRRTKVMIGQMRR